jgi:Na+/proline symporter
LWVTPGKIFTDGLPYAFASFYALTIPFTGVLFLRRQWVLGKAYRYITPGEMYSDYYGGNTIRMLTVLVAFLFSVPYLGVQLRASGDLFYVLTDGLISANIGMFALSAIVMIYVASGGLRSVAFVDCAQAILLAIGIVILGGITIHYAGGWSGFSNSFAEIVRNDIVSGKNLTPDGYSTRVALPGSIQYVSSGSKAIGGPWTGIMCMTYMFALMGIQSSPAFSMWAFSNKTSRAFRWQQVVASSIVIGIILFSFTIIQGVGGHVLIEKGVIESATDKNKIPQLINLLSDSAPWLVGCWQ